METGCANIVALPVKAESKQEAALERDAASLVDVFRELHEVERLTGRAGLSARVRLAVSDILASADKLAKEGCT